LTTPPGEASPRKTAAGDRVALAAVVLVFGFALGQGMLVLPLLAVASGFDPAAVGLLASVSAISQVGMRLTLPRLLARYPDRTMMMLACAALAGSYLVLLLSSSLAVFIVAQLLQGSARAFFWTSSQTHAARAPGGTMKGIAQVTVYGNVGTMVGPAAAGVLATFSLYAPVVVGVVGSLAALVVAYFLYRLPTYERRTGKGGGAVWKRPGVDLACWSNVSTGGWRSLLNSYIPVLMDAVGHPPVIIGAVQAVADALATAAAAALAKWHVARPGRAIGWSVVGTAASLVVFPFVVESAALALLAIAASGLAVGIQMTLGPALASDSVTPGEQGEAIAVAGTFRAGALLVTPSAMSAVLGVLSLPVAMAIAGVVVALPTGVVLGRRALEQRTPDGS
jgi:MFS family permease